MKKHVMIFALMIISSSLFAQLTFGPKIGWNANTLTTDLSTIKEEAKGNIKFGVFARLGKKYYIQPEINFMKMESDFNTQVIPLNFQNPVEATQSLTLQKLDIPILLGVRIIDTKLANVRVFGGPVASMILNKKMSLTANTDGSEFETDQKDKIFTEDNFKNSSWSLNLGAGVDVLMFTLDVRYSFGLSNVYLDDFKDLKDKAFMVSLGWKIL
ncbi:MAG: PorT family protein [Bacteroidales bacterium]|nr:PorT family protein [Bacteroidales bacterium]